MKAALLTNTSNRRNRRHLPEIRRRIAAHRGIEHVETHDVAHIDAALDALGASGTEVLGINGGDGTVHLVLSALVTGNAFARPPIIAALPGGTTNMTARDLNGGPMRFFDALDTFVARALHPTTAQHHVVRVRAPEQPDRYGFFVGMGAIVRGIEFCHERVYKLGVRDEWASGVALLRATWGIATREAVFAQALPLDIRLDGEDRSADTNIFFVTSLSSLFLGIRPFWGTGAAPLNTTLVRAGARRFGRSLPALLRGKPHVRMNDASGYSSWRVQSARVDGAGAFTIDGEMYAADVGLSLDAAGPFDVLPLGRSRDD